MGVAVQKKSQYSLTLDKSVPYHALWQLKREHPHLELKLFAGLSSDFAYRVEHGELDAAIVTELPRPLAASLVRTPLYSELMVRIQCRLSEPHISEFRTGSFYSAKCLSARD